MSAIVKLVQGVRSGTNIGVSSQRLGDAGRAGHLAVVTPYQLWLLKTGRKTQPEVTAAMPHGTELEPRPGMPTRSAPVTSCSRSCWWRRVLGAASTASRSTAG